MTRIPKKQKNKIKKADSNKKKQQQHESALLYNPKMSEIGKEERQVNAWSVE